MMDMGLLSSRGGIFLGDQREWEQRGSSLLKVVKDSRDNYRTIPKMNEEGIR